MIRTLVILYLVFLVVIIIVYLVDPSMVPAKPLLFGFGIVYLILIPAGVGFTQHPRIPIISDIDARRELLRIETGNLLLLVFVGYVQILVLILLVHYI